MRQAIIEIDWDVSHSEDVIRQDLTIFVKGENDQEPVEVVQTALLPHVNTYQLKVYEKSEVYVKIVSYDGTYYSKPMVNRFNVPDLTVPCPPTNSGWKILEIDEQEPCY